MPITALEMKDGSATRVMGSKISEEATLRCQKRVSVIKDPVKKLTLLRWT